MKQSSSNNSGLGDLASKRAKAEAEAKAILKERTTLQKKKNEELQTQYSIKAKAETRKKKAEARKKKAEAAKAKAEEEIRKVEAALEEKQINVGNFFSHNKKYIILGSICLTILLLLYLPFGFLTTILGIIFYLILFYYIYKLLSRFFPSCSGCFAIYLVGSAILCIFLFVRSCKNERESERYSTEMNTVVELDDKDEIVGEDNSSVEEMLEKRFDYVSENTHYFEVRKNGMYGIADLKGNIMIAPKYDYIGSEDEELGIVEVKKDGKYGVVSLKTLTEIIKPKYDYIGSASEESKTIEVRTNDMYGLLSSENMTEILEPTYDYIGIYNDKTELFEVRNNSLYGLYSPKKKIEVAPCIYDFISYDGGLYRVRKDEKRGYLNDDGSVLKPLQ